MFNKLSNCRLAANHQRKTKSEQNPKAPSSNGMIHHWEPWRRNAPNCNCSLSMQLLEVESHLTAYDMMHAFNIVKLGTSSSNLSMRLPRMEPLSWVHPIDWFMKEKLQNLIFGWSDGMHVFGSFWSPCIVCCKLNLAAMIWGTMLLDIVSFGWLHFTGWVLHETYRQHHQGESSALFHRQDHKCLRVFNSGTIPSTSTLARVG